MARMMGVSPQLLPMAARDAAAVCAAWAGAGAEKESRVLQWVATSAATTASTTARAKT